MLDYDNNRAELLERSNDVFYSFQDGKLKVIIEGSFPLDKTAKGHLCLEASKSEGKIFLLFKSVSSGDKTSLYFYCKNPHVLSLNFN